jgi:hypothetical protein
MDSETQAKVFAAAAGRDAHLPVIETGEDGLRLSCCEDGEHVPDLLSWAGCGALLEALRAKGWRWRLDSAEHNGVRDPDSEHPVPWHDPALEGTPLCTAMFTHEHTEERDAWAEAPTLPLAVARAAAAALGVEEGRA